MKGELLYEGMDGFWFEFPTPFQKGDIVKFGDNETLLVITEIEPDSVIKKRLERNGCSLDMVAWGYMQYDDMGIIYDECMHAYMDLEYYRGEFVGIKRILLALSNFLKDEISLELFVNAYRTIIEEEKNKLLFPIGFTDEGLRLLA